MEKVDAKQDNDNPSFQLKAFVFTPVAIVAPILPDFIRRSVAGYVYDVRAPQKLNQIPEDNVRQVTTYLNPADKLNFARSNKENLRLIKPELRLSNFLHCVARGEQDEAEGLLNKPLEKGDYPNLLLARETFTDYSGRTFKCTAYEYAYWAKDSYMLRMFERHMDQYTKAEMCVCINTLEREGLAYQQHGKPYQNPHYDMSFAFLALSIEEFRQLQRFIVQKHGSIVQERVAKYTRLEMPKTVIDEEKEEINQTFEKIKNASANNYKNIAITSNIIALIQKSNESLPDWNTKLACDFNSVITAQQRYIDGTAAWLAAGCYDAVTESWVNGVGGAQCDLPANKINEMCRPDRSFHPLPAFNEGELPRVTMYHDFTSGKNVPLLPLVVSASSGLGVDFALYRGEFADWSARAAGAARLWLWDGLIDLAAISHLDKVRTAELMESLESLELAARAERGFGPR